MARGELPTPLIQIMKNDYKRIRVPAIVGIKYPQKTQKTVVVVGSGRGGTSCVSGTLHILGIRMMESSTLNSEDTEIVDAFQKNMPNYQRAVQKVTEVISERNNKYDVWGWKDPSSDLYLESVFPILRNPHFIFVFRNPLDVALSHVATKSASLEAGLDSSLNRYLRYWGQLQKFGCPTLFVSYERSVAQKKEFIGKICEFLEISPSREKIRRATDFIGSDGGYREAK